MPENLTVLPAAPTVNAYEIIGKIDDSLGGEASAIAPGVFNSPGPKWLLRVLKQTATPIFTLCAMTWSWSCLLGIHGSTVDQTKSPIMTLSRSRGPGETLPRTLPVPHVQRRKKGSPMNYPHVVNYFRSHAWAVQESTFGTMLELVAKWERGEKFSAAEVAERISQANTRQGFNRADVNRDTVMISGGSRAGGGGRGSSGIVALIPILGVISHRAQMLEEVSSGGGTSHPKTNLSVSRSNGGTRCPGCSLRRR